ncbi:MAG: FAD:protein FMN transferase [Pirellulales bacterium]
MARVGEEFPLLCPAGGGDIRLAPSVKNRHSGAFRGLGMPATASPARTRQRPARARSRLTDRKTVAEVPLTGLSSRRLAECGSSDHLVELGGEVRAWGSRADGGKWRVRLRHGDATSLQGAVIELSAGGAVATATARRGRSPIDSRTGRVVQAIRGSATVCRPSCADAWAVATLILGSP